MDLDETWQVGLRPEKTISLHVSSEIALWVSERARKMGRRGVVFLSRVQRTTSALSLNRFPPNFPRTRVQVVARDTWFHIPEKFPLRDRICRKNPLFRVPYCDQPTGHGKRSATPTLFPSPSGHSTDVPFLGDFCCGMYRLPAIHLRKCPYQQRAYMDGDTVAPPGERLDTTQYAYNFWPTVLSVAPLVQCVVCLSVCRLSVTFCILAKRLDRFAWNFQGRCGVTMGRRDYILGHFGETARCRDTNFFDSNITRKRLILAKRLDRFAWNFQGRCGVTMGRPD